MIRSEFAKQITTLTRRLLIARQSSTKSSIDIKKLEEDVSEVEIFDDEAAKREEEIENKRNKSRLREADRKILFDENPYREPKHWHHGTLRFLRRTYGRYGAASGVNPAICWPTKEEFLDKKEYEKVKYYYTIQEVVEAAKERVAKEEQNLWDKQKAIAEKVKKLDQWKKDLYNRIAKKEQEAAVAKDRKERLIEEVRRHFGYKLDPKDDRFKELLAKKEKEQRKVMKEARKKAKEEKMVEKLLQQKKSKSKGEEAKEEESIKNDKEL